MSSIRLLRPIVFFQLIRIKYLHLAVVLYQCAFDGNVVQDGSRMLQRNYCFTINFQNIAINLTKLRFRRQGNFIFLEKIAGGIVSQRGQNTQTRFFLKKLSV